MQAWFPTGKPIPGFGFLCADTRLLVFQLGQATLAIPRRQVPYTFHHTDIDAIFSIAVHQQMSICVVSTLVYDGTVAMTKKYMKLKYEFI